MSTDRKDKLDKNKTNLIRENPSNPCTLSPVTIIIGIWLCILSAHLRAQDVDENALFADTASVAAESTLTDSSLKPGAGQKKSLGFSGTVLSVAEGGINQGFGQEPDAAHTAFSSRTVGDLSLDARLPGGVSASGSLEVQYHPGADWAGKNAQVFLPELFVDAVFARTVYVRAGKQVLQWGRCYLWNPTDLLNTEKKTFEPKIGLREGTYGIKLQVPAGRTLNLYGFAGTGGVTRLDSISATVKAEVLVSTTEMGFSLWGKRGSGPVFGYDLSTRLLGWDINTEAALHQRIAIKGVSLTSSQPEIISETRYWIPRIALNAGRGFSVAGRADRLRTIMEVYYNRAGNTLRDIPLDRLPDSLQPAVVAAGGSSGDFISRAIASGLYEPNSFSRLYAAVFASLDEFPVPELTLSLGALGNLTERCAIAAVFLTYRNGNGFSLALNLYGYAGPKNTEYTIPGARGRAQLTARLDF
jgi:hypothetical protein